MSLGNVHYDTKYSAWLLSVQKLVKASNNNRKNVEEYLSGQVAYTLHGAVRKSFPRNPYTVTNIDDVWEMDLCSLSKYNDKYK